MKLQQDVFLIKTNIKSEYEIFWITYEVHKESPEAELTIVKMNNQIHMILILNSKLSLADIQIIFLENSIDYEFVTNSIIELNCLFKL